MTPCVVVKDHRIVVPAHAVAHQVADQQRQALVASLALRVGVQITAFGRKTHAERRRRQGGNLRQDVGILCQGDGQVRARLFDLVLGRLHWAVVGHRRHTDEDVGIGERPQHRRAHVPRAGSRHALHAQRHGQRYRPAHQHDLGTRLRASARQRVTHLSRTDVGDATHRIDGFESRPGSHHHLARRQALGHEIAFQQFEKFLRLEHAPHADLPAGLVSRGGAEYRHAVLAQLPDVALGGRRIPHLAVHRRRDDERHIARQAQRREQVIGQPMHQAGDEIGRRWRHQDRVRVAAEINVRHVVGHARIPQIRPHRVPRQCLEGHRRDEARAPLGQHDMHVGS